MKQFFASLFGTLMGLALFFFMVVVLTVGVVVALASHEQKKQTTVIHPKTYLTFDLATILTDAPPEVNPSQILEQLGSDHEPSATLREVTSALDAAASDKRIDGLVLQASGTGSGVGGFAMRRELRGALEHFKKSGKKIWAYVGEADLKDYYVVSVADRIILNPAGGILLPGLSSERMYLARALEKAGVGIQVTRCGKYKSAVEPLISDKRSPEDREQIQQLLDVLWTEFTATAEEARHLKAGSIQTFADSNPLIDAEDAKSAGLVDDLEPIASVIDQLKKATGSKKSDDTFRQMTLLAYGASARETAKASGNDDAIVAVVYAEGTIVNGRGESNNVGSEKLARTLRQVRNHEDVKAIVLRVNSPGGSASAADEIVQELVLARQAKIPVVISMGDLAASGGYWIATASDQIVAQPNTITGSIGVFGVLPNIEKLSDTLGLNWDTVSTGRLAGFYTVTRAKTPEELSLVQRAVDKIYQQFLTKVATARKLKVERVQEIAQGRVWSGRDALKLGLVDQLGNLQDAIQSAAALAKVTDYKVEEYPKSTEFLQKLVEKLQQSSEEARVPGVGTQLVRRVRKEYAMLNSLNDPRGVYAMMPFTLEVR